MGWGRLTPSLSVWTFPQVSLFIFVNPSLISLLYNGEICVCVCHYPHFFELNQNGHNSVNFQATASRFCMEEDLEEVDEDMVVEVDDDKDDDNNNDDGDNNHNSNNVLCFAAFFAVFCIFYIFCNF